jgi:hypothetical protein
MNGMNGVLTAANKKFRSIGGDFANFYRSASSVDLVSREFRSQQVIYVYYRYRRFAVRNRNQAAVFHRRKAPQLQIKGLYAPA